MDIIQAYFFNKDLFNENDVLDWLISHDLPINQKISEHKYYLKVKLLSEKKLKLEGYNIILTQFDTGIKINKAIKSPIKNSFVSF